MMSKFFAKKDAETKSINDFALSGKAITSRRLMMKITGGDMPTTPPPPPPPITTADGPRYQ